MQVDLIRVLAEWLLTYALHSTLLLTIVLILSQLVKEPSTLERLWRLGLLGSMVTTSLQVITRGSAEAVFPGAGAAGPLGLLGSGVPLNSPVELGANFTLLRFIVFLWILTGLGGLAILATRYLRLGRLLKTRMLLERRSRVWGTSITVSERIQTPSALMSGEVCLPVAALERLSGDELDAVLAHEIAHLERRDPIWLLIVSLFCRMFFFQPLNWLAARRLHSLAEFLCDEKAARRTSPLAVASALANVSAWGSPHPAGIGMASSESLTVKRVKRLLVHPPLGRRRSTHPAMLFTGVMLMVGLFGPVVGFRIGAPLVPYTISAFDESGPFTVTLNRGKVTGATMNGEPVPEASIHQQGSQVSIGESAGRPALELTLTEEGGLRWNNRPRVSSN